MAQQRIPIRFTGAGKATAVLGLRVLSTVADPAALCEKPPTPAPA